MKKRSAAFSSENKADLEGTDLFKNINKIYFINTIIIHWFV